MKQSNATNIVFYDGECPLCASQMRLLKRLDWFDRIEFFPLSDARATRIAPNLRREDLLEAIHCITREGHIHRGARCLRFVGLRIPLLAPFALFLWFPGVIWIAEKFYMWTSRRRYSLSRIFGCKEACAVSLVRNREFKSPRKIER
ncbi:MAG: DUF393 domain-containing protein [Verrucomicrobiota bacterium]